MQRLKLLAPGEAEMMIAPASRDGEVQLVAACPFERPAIVLPRSVEHVERMGGGNGLVLMGKGHPALLGAANQKRSTCSQPDTRFCGGTRVPTATALVLTQDPQ